MQKQIVVPILVFAFTAVVVAAGLRLVLDNTALAIVPSFMFAAVLARVAYRGIQPTTGVARRTTG